MNKLCYTLVVLLLLVSCGNNRPIEKVSKQEVANSKQETLENLGVWTIDNYVDDFNDKTDKQFVSTHAKGKFSSSIAANSSLGAKIIIDKEKTEIKLYENNGANPVTLEKHLIFKVKEGNGDTHTIPTYKGILMTMANVNTDSLFRAILCRGGELEFTGVLNEYGLESKYNFKIPSADHFQEALAKINN